ncbi:unnamed protein product [Trichobilharzia regenti]|nr:unnamed protein product [Trichobilharzia regenti]
MHEKHDGVQDMACDTFIETAQKCQQQLVTIQYGEVEFIEEIRKEVDIIINDLQPQQVHTFNEADGVIISPNASFISLDKENYVPCVSCQEYCTLIIAAGDDHQKNLPFVPEAEVLNLMATLVNRLQDHFLPALPQVLDAVLQSTLEMIDMG